MLPDWRRLLERWQGAGLIDAETAARITAFETRAASPARFEWPVLLALILGGIALGAGLLLFVAANWDRLSPGARFSLVLFMVAIFHFAGAASARDKPAFQSALHAIATIAFGAGIALTGQIFQLPVDWPAGTLLWVVGAAVAWFLLRDTAQLAILSVLVPLWLGAEFVDYRPGGASQVIDALLLLAIVYLGAVSPTLVTKARIALAWVGGIALLPLTIAAGLNGELFGFPDVAALLPPFALAALLRRGKVWIPALFAGWILILHQLCIGHSFLVHLWSAFGSVGLIAWGWQDGRAERINLGVAGFALSILSFYVSNVLDKLGRSASLITLGVLLVAGGFLLERARRRLVRTV